MRIKNLKNSAFSLLEVLLSAVIFVIAVSGIFATLSAVRTPVANRESALAATIYGKQVLEALRSTVSAQSSASYYSCTQENTIPSGTCSDFGLSVGQHALSSGTLSANGVGWPSAALSNANKVAGVPYLTYTVFCADGSAGSTCGGNSNVAHKVTMTINW